MALRPSLWNLLLVIFYVFASDAAGRDGYVTGRIDGKEYLVRDDRRPTLYTRDYGSCMASTSFTINRFDAAYYKDNMTVMFHLGGETTLQNETIMMFIGVYAYGESRFNLTFNPCSANIKSACPMQSGIPIEADGFIPISEKDVSGIPAIALAIPDFEGQVILRMFSNSTQSEIGCFTATLTNGNSLSQLAWVSSILGGFTLLALVSSFATAIYGDNIAEIRKHYAHSLSVLVVFAVWQHIYFSGALSVNWPSILVAFWSNFGWAGGMIYTGAMQKTIDNFIGPNKGNTTTIGAAGTGEANPTLGGGFDIHQIYKRDNFPTAFNVPESIKWNKYNLVTRHLEESLAKREDTNAVQGFSWYGYQVKPGIPLPGNYSGFAGTLGQTRIPASNAFMTGFLWFLVLQVIIATAVVSLKIVLEGLSLTKTMKKERLAFFRTHYLGYTALAVLRTLYIGFFVAVFLTLFQFKYLATPAPVVVACVLFLTMLGLGGLAGYAYFYRIKHTNYTTETDRLLVVKRTVLKVVPWYTFERHSKFPPSEDKIYVGSLPWWRVCSVIDDKSVYDDEDFTKKFGWLASRFRQNRWWFFVIWLAYEFVRACFLAGAASEPMVQVFGLLAVEVIAFIGFIILRPFEGQRLNVLVVYLLGFSKIATLALSAALDVHFNLPRILATVIGIVIIVIHGLLTLVILIAILSGAATTYMSVMRNHETIHPTRWIPVREKYFEHLNGEIKDIPLPSSNPRKSNIAIVCAPASDIDMEPSFNLLSLKRAPKIEDEDQMFLNEISGVGHSSPQLSLLRGVTEMPRSHSRAPSFQSQMSYSSLPYGARVHRATWSTHDFNEPYLPGRRWTGNNSTTPPLNNRSMGNSDNVFEQASPLSANINPFATPVSSPATGSSSASSIPRPKSWRSSMSSGAVRPQLRTVPSESEIPPIPRLP